MPLSPPLVSDNDGMTMMTEGDCTEIETEVHWVARRQFLRPTSLHSVLDRGGYFDCPDDQVVKALAENENQ